MRYLLKGKPYPLPNRLESGIVIEDCHFIDDGRHVYMTTGEEFQYRQNTYQPQRIVIHHKHIRYDVPSGLNLCWFTQPKARIEHFEHLIANGMTPQEAALVQDLAAQL